MVRSLSCFVLLLTAWMARAELTPAQLAGTAALPAETYLIASKGKHYVVSHPDEKIHVELLSADGNSTMLLAAKPPAAESAPIDAADVTMLPKLGGVALWQDRLVCCLTRESALILIDLKSATITSRQALPDFPHPRAAAYDPKGKLWMFSDNSLTELEFTSDGHFNPIHHQGDFDHPEQLLITPTGKFYIAENGASPQVLLLSADRKLERKLPLAAGETCSAITRNADGPVIWLKSGKALPWPKLLPP
jgi:hypothetical protein